MKGGSDHQLDNITLSLFCLESCIHDECSSKPTTQGEKISMIKQLFKDNSAELDEKALLIALFVIAAIVGLSPLGAKVAQTFRNVSAAI
jgi:Flp pilus assembly pilin Flp